MGLRRLSLRKLVVKLKKKEKESENAQGDVRGMGKEGVAESSPAHVGLTEET